MTDRDFVEFFFDEAGIHSVATLDCYRTLYTGFYRWCIEKGYTDNRNPFEERVLLAPDMLAGAMAKKGGLYYYDERAIDMLCERFARNSVLTEVLIRCFYEGFSSYDELIHLQRDQLDLKHQRVRLEKRRIRISRRLAFLFEKLLKGEVWLAEGRNGYQLRRLEEGDVFLFRIAKDTDANRKQFLKRRLEKISECAGRKVTAKLLYQSGLLQVVRKACGYHEERLIRVLYKDKNKKTNFVLDKILKEKGYLITGSRVRYMFKPYMLQLLASREKAAEMKRK